MDAKDLQQKTREELTRLAAETRAELHELRLKAGTRALSAVRSLRAKRKDLARVLTALNHTSS